MADPSILRVSAIAQARESGLTWSEIGSVTTGNPDPKAAKRRAKRLAREANRKAALMLAEGGDGA